MIAWEWTKLICCNRPIESTNERIKQQQLHNQQIYKPSEVVIVDEQYNQIYESQNHHQYHQQQPLSTSSLYSFNNHEYSNRLAVSPSVSAGIAQSVDTVEDTNRNGGRIRSNNIANHSNGINSMDGIRVQFNRRKSGGGNGASFRSPSVRRPDQFQITLRGWLYRLEGAAIKQWKRRWFVLGEYCLFHYKDSDEEKLLGSVLLPSYRVTPCMQSEDGITRKHAFKLEHQNMKTYYLATDSKESMTQWMNALSLASIMQVNVNKQHPQPSSIAHLNSSPSSSYPPRIHSEAHDVNGLQQMVVSNDENEELEEESGFVSYKPRRLTPPSNAFLGSGEKYPGTYNSAALPTISYPSAQYRMSNQLLPHQKRSHYVNAPPKPRRQQIGDTIYDYSDNFHNKGYPIPPGAQYHQSYVAGNGPAPDLIVHNNGNGNYLPPSTYYGYFAQNRNHLNNHHSEGTNTASPLSSPSSPTSSNAHYSVLPASRMNPNHNEATQSYISPPPQFRLPVRPHSADFLEREHEDNSNIESEPFYDRSQQQQQQQQQQRQPHYPPQQHYQQKQSFHIDQRSHQQQQQQTQQLPASQRVPLRSKSSLERYDPYYYKYYEDYDTPQQLQESISGTAKSISSVTSPPHRPWSDYLQQQSQRELSDRNSTTPTSSSTAARHKPQPPTSLLVPDIPAKCQQSQQQREDSLQRLLEWKQRMLQSPLTKRNVNGKSHSRNAHSNQFQQAQDANGDIPVRPPLPKEYKSKVSMLYKSDKDDEKRNEPVIARERSKSFGSLVAGNDVCYSSDDEGTREAFTVFSGSVPEPMARKRRRHQSDANIINDSDERKSPEYMNINYFEPQTAIRSGGDGQEQEVDAKQLTADISNCDDCTIETNLCYEESLPLSPLTVAGNDCRDLTITSDNQTPSSLPSNSDNLTRSHLRISFRSALSTSCSSKPTSMEVKQSASLKSPPTPPPKPSKVASFDENKEEEEDEGNREKQRIVSNYGENGEEEDDVIRKLMKFYNSQRARAAPNFVKDRIRSFETDNASSPSSSSSFSHLTSYRSKFGLMSGIASDSEIIEKNFNFEDDRITTKSAPAVLTPLTSVLADLRKTADIRKETAFLDQHSDKQNETRYEKSDDCSDEMSKQQQSSLENCDEEDHGYLTMESKLSGNGDDVYVPMSSFVNDVSLKRNPCCTKFEDDNDAGAEADDEASRDFDSIQYQNEVLQTSLYNVPKSDPFHSERMKQMNFGCETKPKWFPSVNSDILNSSYYESEPRTAAKPTCHYSSFLSQSWIKDLLNPNPAYESFDGFRVTETRNVTLQRSVDHFDPNVEKAQSGAPYYYSDLLSESEHKALTERIAAINRTSPPPSLLSRCTALNNIRYLGTTSLQKLDVGKRVNKIKTEDDANPLSCSPAVDVPNIGFAQMKRIVDLIPEDYNKNSGFERNEYKAGSTLQKIAGIESKRDQIRQETNAPVQRVKRCFTPLTTLRTNDSRSDEIGSSFHERSLRRRSRSLNELNDDNDPVYENVDTFLLKHEIDRSPATTLETEVALRLEDQIEKEIDVPLLESISTQRLDFDDSSTNDNRTHAVEGFWSNSSDNSSVIELGGSQSGSFSGHKVRRRRISRNSRSRDDLNNVSDSETASKPPPPPPLPLGYNDYGYPYYNLNESSIQSLKQQQKLSRSVGTGLQFQEPVESLRSRLCVSAGDLVGKSHEELVLLLIQMRRTQSHLASTCDQLRLQMESEEKLIEIEPQRRDEHKARFRDLREKLVEAEREYNLRFPVINMIDKMVKLNYGTSTGSVQELLENKEENEFLRDKAKAASTSFLDKLPLVLTDKEDSSPKTADEADQIENDYNTNLAENFQQTDRLEETLEVVQSSLANLTTDNGSQSPSSSSSSDIEKMKKQQNILESELGRVRGLLVQSAKKLEERAAENARIEQDTMMAKSKLNQVLCSPSSSSSTSFNVESHSSVLEAELESIDKAIDDLHAKRKEILESFRKNKVSGEASLMVRASPTGLAGSAPLPEKKKKPATSYMETDVDSNYSRDLAQYCYLRYLIAAEGEAETTPLYENLDATSDSSHFFFKTCYDENKTMQDYMCDEKMKQNYASNLNGDLNNGCVTES